MNEDQQIIYMQARILRLASETWDIDIQTAGSIFIEFKIFQFIRECFDIFHVEGDLAVLKDVTDYLNSKGVRINAENN